MRPGSTAPVRRRCPRRHPLIGATEMGPGVGVGPACGALSRRPLSARCNPQAVEQSGSSGACRLRRHRPKSVVDVERPASLLEGHLTAVSGRAEATGSLNAQREMLWAERNAAQHRPSRCSVALLGQLHVSEIGPPRPLERRRTHSSRWPQRPSGTFHQRVGAQSEYGHRVGYAVNPTVRQIPAGRHFERNATAFEARSAGAVGDPGNCCRDDKHRRHHASHTKRVHPALSSHPRPRRRDHLGQFDARPLRQRRQTQPCRPELSRAAKVPRWRCMSAVGT